MKGIIFFLVISLSSCTGSGDLIARKSKPENLIPQDKFTEVLTEMGKLEGFVEDRYGSVSTFNKLMIRSGDSLLASYHLNRKIFEESLEYYGSRQELMMKINEEILDELNKELGDLESEELVLKDTLQL